MVFVSFIEPFANFRRDIFDTILIFKWIISAKKVSFSMCVTLSWCVEIYWKYLISFSGTIGYQAIVCG